MANNPFTQNITDKDGNQIPNQRYIDWQDGYATGFAQAIITCSKIINGVMKSVDLKLPILSDILDKLK